MLKLHRNVCYRSAVGQHPQKLFCKSCCELSLKPQCAESECVLYIFGREEETRFSYHGRSPDLPKAIVGRVCPHNCVKIMCFVAM